MTTLPVRLDRLQAGIIAWVESVIPSVTTLWAPSEYPREAADDVVVAAKLLLGPDGEPGGSLSRSYALLPTAATLRVLPAAAAATGESVGLRVSGRRFEFTIPPAATTAIVRDGLLAAIGTTESSMVSATWSAVGTDTISITQLELGDLYQLELLSSLPGLAEVVITGSAIGRVSTGDVSSLVELQAYGRSRYLRSGAGAALQRLRGTVRLPTPLSVLDAFGLAIVGGPGPVVPLDDLAGPTWQSRAAWRVSVAQLSLAAEPLGGVSGVRASLDLRGATAAPILVTLPIVTPP